MKSDSPLLDEPKLSASKTLWMVGVSLVDQVLISGTRFVTSIALANYAGNEELGIFSVAFGFLLIATCVQDALICTPFTLFYTRANRAKHQHYFASVSACAICIMMVTSLCFGLSSGWITWRGQTGEKSLGVAFAALFVMTPFLMLRDFARRIEIARLKIVVSFLIDLIASAVQLAIIAALGYSDRLDVGTAFFAAGVGCAIPSLIWAARIRKQLHFNLTATREHFFEHWNVARWPLISQVIGALHFQSVLWIIAGLLGTASVGEFVACNYVFMIMNPFALGICNMISPISVNAYSHSGLRGVRKLNLISMLALGGGVSLAVAAIVAQSDWILSVLYPKNPVSGQGFLMLVLGANMLLTTMHMVNDQGVWAIEKPQWLFHSMLLTTVGTLIAAFPLIHFYGLVGAALSLLLGRSIGVLYQYSRFFLLTDSLVAKTPVHPLASNQEYQ